MKLQPASRREVARMAVGCGVCAIIELVGFFLLSQFGIGQFTYRMITGALGGTAVAILNFAMMCLMVQNATGIRDEKLLKAKVQGSYNLRIFVQAGWVAAAFFLPWVNVIAAAVPLLFPTAVIYYLQMTGKLLPPVSTPAAPKESAEEKPELEDHPGPFEV